MRGKSGMLMQSIKNNDDFYTDENKPNPITDYLKNSSCFIFHKKSKLREIIFKVVIDPELETIDSKNKKVDFNTLTEET